MKKEKKKKNPPILNLKMSKKNIQNCFSIFQILDFLQIFVNFFNLFLNGSSTNFGPKIQICQKAKVSSKLNFWTKIRVFE